MVSLRIHSYDTRNKDFKSKHYLGKRESSSERPTPLDFDTFIPWFCLELNVSKNVIIRRTQQAEYVPLDTRLSKDSSRKSYKSNSRSTKIKISSTKSTIDGKKNSATASAIQKVSFPSSTINIEDAIAVTTVYDKHGLLVEIAIIGSPYPIPRKVIQGFNLCLPFHSGLFKLSIKKGGLHQIVLYEISKLLPHSNITEVCLDDSVVPDGGYSLLLSRLSQIKYLSLKRCSINDEECKSIAANIDIKGSASKTLLVLDLTSNMITDKGAQALGEAIKTNRKLQHLNISGNNITDTGTIHILRYLQEFPLSLDDIKQKRARRLQYLLLKSVTYEKCLKEARIARLETCTKKDCNTSTSNLQPIINVSKLHKTRKKTLVQSFFIEDTTVEEEAEKKTNEIIGDFDDPYNEEYVKRKGDSLYGVGNFTLTSLNLAYNNLTCFSMRKLLNVIKYQSGMNKVPPYKGLLRVVVDGNNIPSNCNELYEIDLYLKRALSEYENQSVISLSSSRSKRI